MAERWVMELPEEEFGSDIFRETWDQLSAEAEFNDIGLTYSWNKLWWDHFQDYGAGTKELRILVIGESANVIGIAPLMCRRIAGLRVLQFIGQSGGATTDYCGFIIRRGRSAEFYMHFFQYLFESRKNWDLVDITVPPVNSLFSDQEQGFRTMPAHQKLFSRVSVPDVFTVITLPENFEDYVAGLGKRTRTDIRQYLRIAEEKGFEFGIVQGQEMSRLFPPLVELNMQNWNYFSDDKIRSFYEDEIRSSVEKEPGQFLAFLQIGNRYEAIIHGFFRDKACYLHTSGINRMMTSKVSPGLTLYAWLIRYLISDHYRFLDLSPGIEAYKVRLGAVTGTTHRFLYYTSGYKLKLYSVLAKVRKASRKVRSLRPAKTSIQPND